MVYKKYIKRGGKTYGPYYYESYREDGRVKTKFVRGPTRKDKIKKSVTGEKPKRIYQAVFLSLLLIGITLAFFFGSLKMGALVISEDDNRIEIVEAYKLDAERNVIGDVYDIISKKDDTWLRVKDGEFIRIKFEKPLTSQNDISIFARSVHGGKIEVYEENSDNLLMTLDNIKEEKWYKRLLINLLNPTQIFDLKILGDIEIDYVTDPEPQAHLWNKTLSLGGTEIAYATDTDSQGNVYITGDQSSTIIHTVKYNSSCQIVWNVTYNDGSSDNLARGITTDDNDTVYVAGRSRNATVIIKYNATNGNQIANITYVNGTGRDIEVDNQRNLYLITSTDIFNHDIVKYNNSGTQIWNTSISGGVNSAGITIDTRDRIFVASTGGITHWLVLAYNATTGTHIWNNSYSSGFTNSDESHAISVDSTKVYVTGRFENVDPGGYITIAYNITNGTQIWNATNGLASQIAYGIALDSLGGLYVTGENQNNINTIKYNTTNGSQIWNTTFPNGIGYGVTVDSENYVYITGRNGSANHDFLTIKYNNVSASDATPPVITITLSNNTNSSNVNQDVNYTVTDESGVSACWYSNDTHTVNTTLANCANITTVVWNQGPHNLTIYSNDTVNNLASKRVSFTIDATAPTITLVDPANQTSYTSNAQLVTFSFNVSDTLHMANCSLIVGGIINHTNTTINKSLDSFAQTFSPDSYQWSINCTDNAGNIANSQTRTFTVATPTSGGGGDGAPGGGSGSSSGTTQEPTQTNCINDWQCSLWSSCIDKKQARTCNDKNKCSTQENKPEEIRVCGDEISEEELIIQRPTIINNILESIGIKNSEDDKAPDFSCSEWSVCFSQYGAEEVVKGAVQLKGTQTRTCTDKTRKAFDVVEQRSCEIKPVIQIKKIDRCFINYLEVLENEQPIARLESLSNKLNINLPLSETNFCTYCYNGIKDFDEDEIDCVHPNSGKK